MQEPFKTPAETPPSETPPSEMPRSETLRSEIRGSDVTAAGAPVTASDTAADELADSGQEEIITTAETTAETIATAGGELGPMGPLQAGLEPVGLEASGAAAAPLREIATAFRMNAEALHTLKQMQSDLTDSVKRGDRSQLVLQSTRALNETFRNLTAVQRELLTRLDTTRPAPDARRSPVVPMLILGLLAVMLGGIYVILDAIERREPRALAGDAPDVAERVMDSWKLGQREGAEHAEAELRRLQDALEEAKDRRRSLEQELDGKSAELAAIDRSKRTAELERDEFAGQIRKAQSEVVAKKALEQEILSLTAKTDGADRIVRALQQDLDLQRRSNAFLRQRLADYGMGYSEDDPPWRPGTPAGAPEAGAPGRITQRPESDTERRQRAELLRKGLEKMGRSPAEIEEAVQRSLREGTSAGSMGSASDRGGRANRASASSNSASSRPGPTDIAPAVALARSAVPPPAIRARDEAGGRSAGFPAPARAPHTSPRARTVPGTQVPPPPPLPPGERPARPSAQGGDDPGGLPPPLLRRRGALQRDAKAVGRVRSHINGLLDTGGGGAGWHVARLEGVAEDRLGGVILTRHDDAGRLVESVEARDVRILYDRQRRAVEFRARDGVRVARNQRTALPAAGTRIVVAEGERAGPWSTSPLTVIQRR